MHDFFIITPLGLEALVLEELNSKWLLHFKTDDYTVNIVEGGLNLNCSLDNGLNLNKILKTSTRILLRIKNQKCRDFPKLFKIIQKMNWKQYLKHESVNWKITTKQSRLLNSTKIEKSCVDAMKKYFNANRISTKVLEQYQEKPKQTIFLRVDNDNLTISLDTSGESLHIRGNDSFRGLASIRSTLASLIIQDTFKRINEKINLVDPMCGTCTYLKETKNFFNINKNRVFAFEDWHLPKELKIPAKTFNVDKFYGFDIDKDIIEKQKEFNLKSSNVFKDKQEIKNALIICNPPYGKRVKLDRPRNIYYKELIDALIKNYSPKYISIIIPSDVKIEKYNSRLKIFNSGIWVYNYFIKVD
jgi:putative N6-adenine-specific DNA methylase